MTDQALPDWNAAVRKELDAVAGRGAQHRRERAGEAAGQQRACEARRAEAEAASGGQLLTLTSAVGAALAEPEPEYSPWKFERPASLWEAIGDEVSERIAQGETRRREVHTHYGYADREPGRAEGWGKGRPAVIHVDHLDPETPAPPPRGRDPAGRPKPPRSISATRRWTPPAEPGSRRERRVSSGGPTRYARKS